MQQGRRPAGTRRFLKAAGCASIALVMTCSIAGPVSAGSTYQWQLRSPLGSYLAGRIARGQNDTAEAVRFYRHALTRGPATPRIIERAFLVEAAEGNADETIALARELVKFRPEHRLARAWLAIAAFKSGKLKQADRHFRKSSAGPIGELTSALARAWVAQKRGHRKTAAKHLKSSQRAEWAQYYLRYHRALIADLNRDRKLARRNYSRIFKSDARMPRVTISYLHHAVNAGQFRLAGRILNRNKEATTGFLHPSISDVATSVKLGKRLPLLINSSDDGLAEVFYGLGEALTTEGGMQLGAIYLQMAIYLKPDFPFAHAALANVYETNKDYVRANAIYEKVPA